MCAHALLAEQLQLAPGAIALHPHTGYQTTYKPKHSTPSLDLVQSVIAQVRCCACGPGATLDLPAVCLLCAASLYLCQALQHVCSQHAHCLAAQALPAPAHPAPQLSSWRLSTF